MKGLIGGQGRNRTGVDGFAGRSITTLPPSLGLQASEYTVLPYRINLFELRRPGVAYFHEQGSVRFRQGVELIVVNELI